MNIFRHSYKICLNKVHFNSILKNKNKVHICISYMLCSVCHDKILPTHIFSTCEQNNAIKIFDSKFVENYTTQSFR